MATEKKIKTQPPATVQNFPIVGVGASAGGLDAFKRLLTAIPESSGMAYVLVQHLDPSHESMLPEILQRVTNIPVHEITEDIHLAPDHIYIIPSNKILTSTDGVLQLAPREKKILNLSIDIFFKTLAEVHKEFAVGVILSGTGKDGTQGLKAIKEYGGISIAQDMESAAYDSMPESAINAGVVDFILAPEKIPEQLLQISRIDKISPIHKKEKQENNDDETIFKQILSQLRQRRGVDFTHYKDLTLRRRIARRIAIVKKKNLSDYLKFLRTDIAEQDALFQDMLIPVTSFFRDPKMFHTLTEKVFPSILKNKNPDAPIRMWIAGCSTGEEVYSIAICLQEFLRSNPASNRERNTQIQIFASDISEKAIKTARLGVYTNADVEMLSAARLETYFTKNNGGYEVVKGIRDICVFAPHNFLKDPPFAKMDLISCRNVLIYMDSFLQQKAFATFHYALKENRFLLLGKSESVGISSDLFVAVANKEKIFSRKEVQGRFRHVATERKEEASVKKTKTIAKPEATQADFKKSAEAIMISKAPASVVVNEQMDIVHIHGDLTPFLQAPQGKPTHNLLSMARDGLTFELRNAIHKASKDKITVTTENIPLKIYTPMNDPDSDQEGQRKQTLVAMEIIPLTDTIEQHYLIRFEKIIIPKAKDGKSAASGKTKAGEAEKRNVQLEKELAYNREDMRSITEDMEAANEELQSANEELQSSNEEMQSLNEELETSKEELQSTNEELIIVNQELFEKQEQLNAARLYSDSIVSTIRHPLIVLDKDLCIKTANAAFYKKFNVDEKETEKKWFYEIQHHQFDDFKLRSLLVKVLSQKNRIDDFEIILKLPDLGERTLLMNAQQIKNDKTTEQLILLAIEDITEKIVARKLIEASEKRFSNILSQSMMSIAILKGADLIIAFANDKMMTSWGKGKNIIGKPLLEVLYELEGQAFPNIMQQVFTTGMPHYGYEEKALLIIDGKEEVTYYNYLCQPYTEVDNSISGVTILANEVTEQVLAKKQIEASEIFTRTILESSPDCLKILDIEGRVQYMNFNGLCQMEIDDFSTVKDKNWELLWGSENEELVKSSVAKALTGETSQFTAKCQTVKGTSKWWDVMVSPVCKPGEPVEKIISVSRDITYQKEAENKLKIAYAELAEKNKTIQEQSIALKKEHQLLQKYFIEAPAFFVILKGNEHVFEFANTMYHKLIGNRDILGKRMMEVMPELKGQEFDVLVDEIHRTGKPFTGRAMPALIEQKKGKLKKIYIDLHCQAIKNEEGFIEGIMILGYDVTEQVEARKQIEASEILLRELSASLEVKVKERTLSLKKSNEELKETNQQLDQFAHVASHDLQEPLRKILTFSKQLQENYKEELSTEVKSYLDKIEGASSRMSTLISDLLNYSRLLGHENLFVQTDLNEILKNVLNDFELLVDEKKAKIKFGELPTIEAIPLQMNQLFYNLISNALKFSIEGVPPIITITSRTLSEKQIKKYPSLNPLLSYVEIIFKDNGIGFEQKYSEKIFTIFQRLHSKDAFFGTGIGLALTKKITENHHGLTFADAKENKGATFHAILPFKQSQLIA